MEKEAAIVLYPSPGMGHLIPMVELGKLILEHYPSFSITILISPVPCFIGSTTQDIADLSAANPSFTFHHLPAISLPPTSTSHGGEELFFEIPRLNNLNFHNTLQTLSQSSKFEALIIDFFNSDASEVAANFNIPTYYFYTSGGCSLAGFLYIPTLHQKTTKNIKECPNEFLDFPGIPPIPAVAVPDHLLVRTADLYKMFINASTQMAKSKGIIVNTFESLEPRALQAISDGLCVPNAPTPPIYCIGPLIATSERGSSGRVHECLSWLNSQPSKSVVFLCFGSMGLFSAKQLMDMAVGLEKSGHRFLWVVRSPSTDDTRQSIFAPLDPNLDEILPKGFLERTKGRGLVVKSWAPQAAVLNHDSVGGFVTHCGWNSILEAVCSGVPMIAWPLYAEQKMNRVFLVQDMKVGLPVEESEGGSVSPAELEKRVRELMELQTGKEVRDRVMAMREGAVVALKEGGSSRVALAKLVQSCKQG